MTIQIAFSTLLTDIEAAFQDSLTRSNTAAQQGDFDLVELEIERQRNLVSIRNQLQTLQDMWRDVVGERPVSTNTEPPGQSVGYSDILSEGYKRVLTALYETGGPEAVAEALNRVGKQVSEAASGLNVDPWHWLFGKKSTASPTGEEVTLKAEVVDQVQNQTDETKEAVSAATPINTSQRPPEALERPIFANYKGKLFEAVLLPGNRVHFNGQNYLSPSGAAKAIVKTGSQSVNGWLFWRYHDNKGREHPITDLRTPRPAKRKRSGR